MDVLILKLDDSFMVFINHGDRTNIRMGLCYYYFVCWIVCDMYILANVVDKTEKDNCILSL